MHPSSLSILKIMTVNPESFGTTGSGFNDRVRRSHLARQAEIGRDLGQDEVGREVGRYLGLEGAVGQGTVSRWFRASIPDLRTIAALALVLNVDPGWLAFGDLSAAPKPRWVTTSTDADEPARRARAAEAMQDETKALELAGRDDEGPRGRPPPPDQRTGDQG